MIRKTTWGEDPQFFGPRDWFRNSLILHEIYKRKKKGKVLDFGCGSGNLLLRLAKKGYACVGVDASSLAVKFLKDTLQRYPLQSVSVHKGNEKFLSSLHTTYDIIVSGETLEHLKSEKLAVRPFHKLLKKGGICVVTVPAHMWQWDINDIYSSHFRRYEKEELENVFIAEGFTVVSCYYWGYPLSLFWHRNIFLPLITKKATHNLEQTGAKTSLLKKLTLSEKVRSMFSLIFWVDMLFNWTNLGGGLILVAEK